jgi:WD repeat-containing protein 23
MSAGWESGRTGSIVARHEWKGLSKMRGKLEDWVEKQRQEGQEISGRSRQSSPLQQMHMPGAFGEGDD